MLTAAETLYVQSEAKNNGKIGHIKGRKVLLNGHTIFHIFWRHFTFKPPVIICRVFANVFPL